MNKSDRVYIISTRSRDIVISESGDLLEDSYRGPAYFLERVFSKNFVPFDDALCKSLEVEILVTRDGEKGRVIKKPRQIHKTIDIKLAKWVVVSTVSDEWDLSSVDFHNSLVFLDIQGYVRDGDFFGRKKNWLAAEEVSKSIFCLKGTREEMRYIPKTVVEEQKKKMLIVTDGIFGVELFYNSQRYFVPSNVVEGLRDTIGAGDTFFAEYISGLINNLEPERALARAVNETSDFLSQKSSLGLVEGSKRV